MQKKFTDEVLEYVQSCGDEGVSKSKLNRVYSSHSSSSISGVLYYLCSKGLLDNFSRGEYKKTDVNDFRAFLINDLKKVSRKYDIKSSNYNKLTNSQKDELTVCLRTIDNCINELKKYGRQEDKID